MFSYSLVFFSFISLFTFSFTLLNSTYTGTFTISSYSYYIYHYKIKVFFLLEQLLYYHPYEVNKSLKVLLNLDFGLGAPLRPFHNVSST